MSVGGEVVYNANARRRIIIYAPYYETDLGFAYLADAKDILGNLADESVRLILTSPPFPLHKKKAYGNVKPDGYIAWILGFAGEFRRVLAADGSLVIELGSGWNKGEPTRSIYQYRVLVDLCERFDFKLAQDFYWYNPAKLPTPAQWVTVKRVRVKDAVTSIWWLAKTPHPWANNREVLTPYTPAMLRLFGRGYNRGRRPSGHVISDKFGRDNGGAIPPNLLQFSNTASNDRYQVSCRRSNLPVHPARFPDALPPFFIKMLTEPGDLVVDPFAGSNIVGYTAEILGRRWIAVDVNEEYLKGSMLRFAALPPDPSLAEGSPRLVLGGGR